MGHQHSTLALHKDYYENFSCVASGDKVFTLYPPSDKYLLTAQKVPAGRFALDDERQEWTVAMEYDNDNDDYTSTGATNTMLPWIDEAECLEEDITNLLNPVTIHVLAGCLLYLPALWFHRVTQTCETVGINYWYDMQFNAKSCYFHLLENARLVRRNNITVTKSPKERPSFDSAVSNCTSKRLESAQAKNSCPYVVNMMQSLPISLSVAGLVGQRKV